MENFTALNKHYKIFSLIIFISLSFLLYINNLTGDFVFDDTKILPRPDIRELTNIPSIILSSYDYQNPETGIYRPMSVVSYAINYSISGLNTWSYHILSVLLHGLVGWLVFLIIVKLFLKEKVNKGLPLALLVSLIYLFYPVHTEPVNSIGNRAEILAGLFGMGSLLFFLNRNKLSGVVLTPLLFLVALLSKESAVVLFGLYLSLIIKDSFKLKKIIKSDILLLFSLIGVVGVYIALRFNAVGQYMFKTNATFVENPAKFLDPVSRFYTGLQNFWIYMTKVIYPFNLSADYSYNQVPLLSSLNLQSSMGLLIMILLIVLAVWSYFKSEKLYIGAILFLTPFFLTSNMFLPIGTFIGERLMYMPLIGLSIILFYLLQKVSIKYTSLIYILIPIVLISFLFKVWDRNEEWSSEIKLYQNMGQTAPNSVLARSNSGAAYILQGDYQNAKRDIIAANNIYDKYPPAVNNLGLIYQYELDYDKAIEYYLKTLKIDPNYGPAHINLVDNYYRSGKYKEALEASLVTLQKDPSLINIRFKKVLSFIELSMPDAQADINEYFNDDKQYGTLYLKGMLELEKNNPKDANKYLLQALNSSPVDPWLIYNIALSFIQLNQKPEALKYIKILQSQPDPYSQYLAKDLCAQINSCN